MIDAMHAAQSLRALLAQFTQDTRLLRLCTSLGADKLLVEHIDGREALSETWCFTITVLCTDAHLDLSVLLGQPALLQLLTQSGELRPIHGHVTAFERLGADGGFARYRLTLEPWLAFLRHRRDSYVWQGKNVLDIIAEIFSDYQDKGMLAPAWRTALADPGQYKPREVCSQFEESDLAFVERLLAEEGLFYWFEHIGDTHDEHFGSHTLVIADHNGAFTANAQATIRYHRASAVEHSDSITAWHGERRIGTNTILLGSWHETQARLFDTEFQSAHDNGDVPRLVSIDHPGVRRFGDQEAVERSARLQLEALEARNKMYAGQSTVRTLAPGTTFLLAEHAIHDAARHSEGDAAATFAVISVQHRGRNNLGSDARALIDGLFANTASAPVQEEAIYSNRFTALRADIPWRTLTEDGHGALLHPKPAVHGVHTAIVVGTPGQDIATERDHRIKVQMHWQRGARSHSRLPHPQGDDNAPGNDGAYVWVRVAEAAAGPNFGSSFLPRVGQEVILDYLEGDIDRPVVIGSLYNGKGMDDAQGNQVAQGAGPAIGNAPAWFAGNSAEHAHNAILSGFKTQEIGHSQDGQGGHNALILDDSTGQVGARLHTTQHATHLNLGHIKRQRDNARKQSHGHGVELTTAAYGAARAGQGLLISADERPQAGSAQMDVKEAHQHLTQAHELQQSLSDTAEKHNAFTGKTLDKERHTQPETVLARALDSLAQTAEGIGTADGGGAGTVHAFGRPDLVMSAPGGIALLTPADVHAAAGAITITGGTDVSATIGRNLSLAVKEGISLFTCGDAKAARKEQGDKGIKLHAAQGKVDVQAQSAEVKIAADKNVGIDSTSAKVEVAAKEHVMLTAGGAYIKIAGGNIEIHAPGKVEFKAGMKVLDGPAKKKIDLPVLPLPEHLRRYSVQIDLSDFIGMDPETKKAIANLPYEFRRKSGEVMAHGSTDQLGDTARIYTKKPEDIVLYVGDGEWNLSLDCIHKISEDNKNG
ncbi:type VI secretion system Vgr family protein [Herbaspirillum sp. ST 5-3]|uniref:type VI secretion system Vgr family protein n=1 Tax=Oxalobacteraceae TaxID=75682 RepID=UPI0010A2F3CA|nr:type VI secretion system Vgr family protein [Herbaspirillum sp. ST 5-3]